MFQTYILDMYHIQIFKRYEESKQDNSLQFSHPGPPILPNLSLQKHLFTKFPNKFNKILMLSTNSKVGTYPSGGSCKKWEFFSLLYISRVLPSDSSTN